MKLVRVDASAGSESTLKKLPENGIIISIERIKEITIRIKIKTAVQPIFDQKPLCASLKERLIALPIFGPSTMSTGKKKRYRVTM